MFGSLRDRNLAQAQHHVDTHIQNKGSISLFNHLGFLEIVPQSTGSSSLPRHPRAPRTAVVIEIHRPRSRQWHVSSDTTHVFEDRCLNGWQLRLFKLMGPMKTS